LFPQNLLESVNKWLHCLYRYYNSSNCSKEGIAEKNEQRKTLYLLQIVKISNLWHKCKKKAWNTL